MSGVTIRAVDHQIAPPPVRLRPRASVTPVPAGIRKSRGTDQHTSHHLDQFFLRIVLPDLAVVVHHSYGQAELLIGETRPLAELPTHPPPAPLVPRDTGPLDRQKGGGVNDPGRIFAFEWLLRLLHGLACWLAGRGVGTLVASFNANPLDLPVRRELALARLTKSKESIAQIAAELGYADPSAFYRAFVDWTGMAPLHYRRHWSGR